MIVSSDSLRSMRILFEYVFSNRGGVIAKIYEKQFLIGINILKIFYFESQSRTTWGDS